MEYLTKDTHLDFSTDNGATYKELYGLNGFPDMGGEPEKVDITNMRDGNKRYTSGLTDTGNLSFDFYYNRAKDAETTTGGITMVNNAFAAMKAQEGNLLNWKLTYPDGSSYSWTGKPTVYISSGSVGAPISFKLSVSVESKLDYSEGTAVTTGTP